MHNSNRTRAPQNEHV